MNTEILHIIESVAIEKNIPKVLLMNSIAIAIEEAGKNKYGTQYEIKAHLNHHTGEIKLLRSLTIVDKILDHDKEITLEEALKSDKSASLGNVFLQELPAISLDRSYANIVKNVILQKISEIERSRQYEEYKNREGEIVTGILKRIEFKNLIIDLGRSEAVLKKESLLEGDNYKVGNRIKACISKVIANNFGPQIFLSRTSNQFLYKLMEVEITEIYDNIVQIKNIARIPGIKAKVAVFTSDTTIDAIGACVGIKGSRIKNISQELKEEKIDIVIWDSNAAQFIHNAMKPAKISKILINENKKYAETIVEESQLSIAIGKNGQNVKLASKLTSWDINVMTEDADSKRSSDEFTKLTNFFVKELSIDQTIAQLLVSQNFTNIDQLTSIEKENLQLISEVFTDEIIETIHVNASKYVQSRDEKLIEELEELGVEQDFLDLVINFLTPEYILKIAKYGIKSKEDLEEITISEFRQLVPREIISKEDITKLLDQS
ncbi:MAG: transcription termination factor NusA [Rickettsia sp.]|nr:transcription termination factor NusA [Rickettsia sp.]